MARARLTAGLVSALVLLIVLGVGATLAKGNVVDDLFAGVNGGMALAYFRQSPTMRIISSKDSSLSLAVRGSNVVLVTTDSNDRTQAWIQDTRAIGKMATDDVCDRPFALVNFDDTDSTLFAIVPPLPNNPSGPAELAQYTPLSCVGLSMLWTQGTNTNGFYTINMFRDPTRAFNILGGAFVNNKLGVRPTQGVNENVLFEIVPF